MLTEIMNYLHNYFLVENGVQTGDYEVKDGEITLPFLTEGQFFLVDGSVFNNGVHQYKSDPLNDEKFCGDIAPMAVPEAFLDLCREITEWQEKNGSEVTKPYQSESFGGYSYTRASGNNGASISWKEAFASRLRPWRMI